MLDRCNRLGVFDRYKLSRLRRVFKISAGDVVLDAGCGYGLRSIEASKMGANVVSLDLFIQSLKLLRNTERIFPMRADVQYLPFKNESFDKIICIHVLEHIKKDADAMLEFQRVLKFKGSVFVAVPEPVTYRLVLKIDPHWHNALGHLRIYNLEKMLALSKSCGLMPYSYYKAEFFRAVYRIFGRLLRAPVREGGVMDLKQHPFLFRLGGFVSERFLNEDSKLGALIERMGSKLLSGSYFFFFSKSQSIKRSLANDVPVI